MAALFAVTVRQVPGAFVLAALLPLHAILRLAPDTALRGS
jgi:hypothetical protein